MKKWIFACYILGLFCIIACKSDTSQTTATNPVKNSYPVSEGIRGQQVSEMDSMNTVLQKFTDEIDLKVKQLNATEIELDKAFDLE